MHAARGTEACVQRVCVQLYSHHNCGQDADAVDSRRYKTLLTCRLLIGTLLSVRGSINKALQQRHQGGATSQPASTQHLAHLTYSVSRDGLTPPQVMTTTSADMNAGRSCTSTVAIVRQHDSAGSGCRCSSFTRPSATSAVSSVSVSVSVSESVTEVRSEGGGVRARESRLALARRTDDRDALVARLALLEDSRRALRSSHVGQRVTPKLFRRGGACSSMLSAAGDQRIRGSEVDLMPLADMLIADLTA